MKYCLCRTTSQFIPFCPAANFWNLSALVVEIFIFVWGQNPQSKHYKCNFKLSSTSHYYNTKLHRTVVLWRGMPLCLEHAQTPLYYCGIVMSPYSRCGYECSSNSDWCCFCLHDLLLEECCKKRVTVPTFKPYKSLLHYMTWMKIVTQTSQAMNGGHLLSNIEINCNR